MPRDPKQLRTPAQTAFDQMTIKAFLAALFVAILAVLWVGPVQAVAQIVGNL